MFSGASIFNYDLSGWNTGFVTDISGMFADASSFNYDLSSWNTASVTNMNSTFKGASALYDPTTKIFNYDLTQWLALESIPVFFFSPDGINDTTTTDPYSQYYTPLTYSISNPIPNFTSGVYSLAVPYLYNTLTYELVGGGGGGQGGNSSTPFGPGYTAGDSGSGGGAGGDISGSTILLTGSSISIITTPGNTGAGGGSDLSGTTGSSLNLEINTDVSNSIIASVGGGTGGVAYTPGTGGSPNGGNGGSPNGFTGGSGGTNTSVSGFGSGGSGGSGGAGGTLNSGTSGSAGGPYYYSLTLTSVY